MSDFFTNLAQYTAVPTGDPGVQPERDPTTPGLGWLSVLADWLNRFLPGGKAIPQYPKGDRRNDMVIAPAVPHLDLEPAPETIKKIELAVPGLGDVREGAAVAGTYAFLALLFLLALAVFLTSGRSK